MYHLTQEPLPPRSMLTGRRLSCSCSDGRFFRTGISTPVRSNIDLGGKGLTTSRYIVKKSGRFFRTDRSPAFDSSVCSSIWLLSLLLLLLLSLLISLFLLFHSSALHARDKTQRYRSAHRIKTVGCLQFLLWLYIRLKLFLSSKGGAFRDFQVWHRVQNMLLLA